MSAKVSVGIVGLPNVGKSTLFSALTKKEVNVANYPFATIDPSVGVVEVPDERLDKLAEMVGSAKKIPAVVEFVDIAGLVKGANKGEGLGNQFLSHIREVDVICEVVRCFEDAEVVHVEGNPDPARDMDTVMTELVLKDLETVEKRSETAKREARAGSKEASSLIAELGEAKERLERGEVAGKDAAGLGLLTVKPFLYVLNGECEETKNLLGEDAVVLDAKAELEFGSLSPQEAAELGFSSGLPEVIRRAYELLGFITFFTAGEKETRAWAVKKDTLAPRAAGAIHSDFQDKFIRASVISTDKLLEAGSWADAASQGLVRGEGKEYEVQDGDVLEVLHGA